MKSKKESNAERSKRFRKNNPNYQKHWQETNPDKLKISQKKYGQSEKGKKVHRKAQKKYSKTEKGKKVYKKTQNNFKNRILREQRRIKRLLNSWLWKKNNPNYWKNWSKNHPNYGKNWRKNNPEYHNNYNKTENGKRIHRKANKNYAKRKKLLTTTPIFSQQILVKVVQHKP